MVNPENRRIGPPWFIKLENLYPKENKFKLDKIKLPEQLITLFYLHDSQQYTPLHSGYTICTNKLLPLKYKIN